jgi:hypothetical protein
MHHFLSRAFSLFSISAPVLGLKDSTDHSSRSIHRRALNLNPGWKLTDSFQGERFLEEFTFEAIPDPTHGRVQYVLFEHRDLSRLTNYSIGSYVDKATAIAHNLTEATADKFIMRADSTSVLDTAGPGRESIRLQSKKQWTNGVSILNLVLCL